MVLEYLRKNVSFWVRSDVYGQKKIIFAKFLLFVYSSFVILFLITFFILGTAIGSFLNVVIDRTTRKESILGRSYCDHCRANLSTFDLIPIVSFVTLGAKCRYCKKPLSWQYPLVEALGGILFAVAFLVLAQSGDLNLPTLFYYFFLISIAIVVAAVDFKFSLIPTSFVFLASLVALFYDFFSFSPGIFITYVLTVFVLALSFALLVVATRGRGMGEGDIVLAFLIGIVLGFKATLVALFIAFLSGAVVSVVLILLGKKRFGQTIPFAPFLILGLLSGLFWAKPILAWYLMVY